METRAHHILIGAFTIGVFLLALGFVLWMSKAGVDRQFKDYEIVFREAVTGLSVGGLVQYNGIKVGEVAALSLAPDDARKVIARVRLDANAPVREDTRAKLGLLGVTGLAFIQLWGGAPGSPPLLPTREQPIPRIPSEESALSALLASGSDVVTSVNDILLRVNELLSKDNLDHVGNTLANIDALTRTLADQRQDIGQMLRQLAEATSQLKRTLATIAQMATSPNQLVHEDVRTLLRTMQDTLASIDRAAATTDALLDNNRGALDRFANQGLRQVGPTLVELHETLRSLKQLSDKLGASDSLLLGRDQPKEYQPR
ncbi:MAG: MCE family protein [Rhodanobacteraceae bacterium]|nr:MCE family protein [Rhodanobacteraceae bacterium]